MMTGNSLNKRLNKNPMTTIKPMINMMRIKNPDMPKKVVLILIYDITPIVSRMTETSRLIFFSLE